MKTKTELEIGMGLLVLAVAAWVTPAAATTYTWDGGSTVDEAWGKSENWADDPALSFGNTADVVFYQTKARRNNYLGADRTIRSLTFDANADTNVTVALRDGGTNGHVLAFDADAGSAEIVVDAGYIVADSPGAEFSETKLFARGVDGYNAYRIPAIVETVDGTLLAFCEGRRNSLADDGDIDIVLKRSTNAGATWGAMRIVQQEGGAVDVTIGNPVPVVDRDTGRVWLAFCRDNDRVFLTWSDDDGLSWAVRREITEEVKAVDWGRYATGPAHGVQLERGAHAGRLLIPCNHTTQNGIRGSHVIYSDDHGASWALGGSVDEWDGCIPNECVAVELVNTNVYLNMRDQGGGKRRLVARSANGGASFGPFAVDDTLTEPTCQASAVRYSAVDRGGAANLILFSNPAATTERARMTVRRSYDETASWDRGALIHEGPCAYSDLVTLRDGRIGLLYEKGLSFRYETITFARFNLMYLENATTYTWDGDSSGSWAVAANWAGDSTPSWGNTADLVFCNVASNINPTFIGNSNPIRSLTFNDKADSAVNIELRSNTGVDRVLTFDTDSGSAQITVDSDAAGNHTIGNGNYGSLTLADDLRVTHNGSGTLTIARPINETGGAKSLVKSGTGTFILSAANAFTGGITINGGKLAFNSMDSENNEPDVDVASDGVLSIGAPFNGGTATIGNLSGAGLVDPQFGTASGTRTLRINQTTNGTFSGILRDATTYSRVLAVTKTGAGTLTLTGANAYTGPTTVEAGTLDVHSVNSSYIVTGGTLRAGRLDYGASTADIDFVTAGSTTGKVEIVRPDDYTPQLAMWIASGKIRLDGAVAGTERFAITYDGAKTTLAPGAGVAIEKTRFVGPGDNLQDPANWDRGLPDSPFRTGIVEDRVGVLGSDRQSAGMNLIFRGQTTLGHGVTDGYRINGASVWTFHDAASYEGGTNHALTLGYDTPGAIVLDGSAVMTMASLYLGGDGSHSADAVFFQRGGLVMIHPGALHFSDKAPVYTLSGGTLRIEGGLDFSASSEGSLNFERTSSPGLVTFPNRDYRATLSALIGEGKICIDGARPEIGDFEMLYDDRHTYLSLPAPSYDTWAARFALGNDILPTDDADGDGIVNVVEYALGGHPADPADRGLPSTFAVTGQNAVFEHSWRNDDAALSYVLETTDDLVNKPWAPVTTARAITNGDGTVLDRVAEIVPIAEPRGFFRLRVGNGAAWGYTRPETYAYGEDFSDETPLKPPRDWQQPRGSWRVTGGHALAPVSGDGDNTALLHVFSRDVVFSADVTVSRLDPNGQVFLTGRWNYDPGYFVKAGYGNSAGKWKIIQAMDSATPTAVAATSAALPLNRTMRLTLQLSGDRAALLVDGVEVCSGTVANRNWGKVGLYCKNADAVFDNVAYEGTGRVEAGIEEFWNPDDANIGHPWFFDWNGRLCLSSVDANGDPYLCPLNTNAFGAANWLDWDAREITPSHRIIRMKDGRLAAFILKTDPKRWTCRFLDVSGGAWSAEVDVFQPGETYEYLTMMPSKISQTADGDIWIPSGIGNEDALLFGDFVLHKSEDYGRTWRKMFEFRQQSADPGMNGIVFAEAEVVEKGNGDLVCFGRRHQDPFGQRPGSHGMIVSADDGSHWSLPPEATPFLAARSSFNSARDPDTGEIFFLWVYEDSRAVPPPNYAQPRHRVSLASSKDDMRTWRFLLDIDDWKGQDNTRQYNPTLHVTPDFLYIVVKTREMNHPDFQGAKGKRLHFFRIDRSKLKPHATWPSTHSTVQ